MAASRYVQAKSNEINAPSWLTLNDADITASGNDLLQFFSRYPVERNHPRSTTGSRPVRRSGEVVVAAEIDKLTKVFGDLITEGFLSCPIVASTNIGHFGKYRGFVDLLDITKCVVEKFQNFRTESSDQTGESGRPKALENYLTQDRFKNLTIKDLQVENINQSNPVSVHRGYSLMWCIEAMVRSGARRVPVCDGNGIVRGIVTNSMVVSLIDQNSFRLGSIGDYKVRDMMGGLCDELITVYDDDTAFSAFMKMYQNNITGLAVIDHNGHLVDTIAVRDLRIIGEDMSKIERLYLTCKRFKEIERDEFKRQTPRKPIYVTLDDNFSTVISNMDDGNIHRIFVCNEKTRNHLEPKSIITQRDVMKFLMWRMGFSTISFQDLTKVQNF